ncbi:hypothetical protein Tco_0392780 [Tanacetum coccineum]
MNVEALQTKYPIIDWEIYTEGTRKYWKIIRVGNHTEVHQLFNDMLKALDRDDLVMLWSLVKERFNSIEPTDDKEREIWVELKRLFKPDTDDEEGNKHLHADREGVSIVKRNSYTDAGCKVLEELFTHKEEMDLETAQTTTTAKLPILKQGEYDMWRLRIEQYFQVQDYALWDVIENGNSFKPVAQTTTNADGTSTDQK